MMCAKRVCCMAILAACLAGACGYADVPAKVPRMLLVGDSWTGFMWGFRSFKEAFEERPGLENYVEVGSRTAVMGARAFEFYPDVYNYIQAVQEELLRYPTIDIVTMTLGGNDFLRGTDGYSRWDCGMLTEPAREQALLTKIAGDIEGIIDAILAVRPDIRVAICGYTFGGRDRGGCSIYDQQMGFVHLEEAKKAIADRKDRVFYVHNFGMMQYYFGTATQDPGLVTLPGGYPDYTPFPGGDPSQLVNPVALFDADIHLTRDGYSILANRCIDEFYAQWLAYPKAFEIVPVSNTAGQTVFRVIFSEPVNGVDITDFQAVDDAKAALPVIDAVGVSGGMVFNVIVNSSGAAGMPHLTLADDDSIVDADLNPLGGPGTGPHVGNGDFFVNGVMSFEDPLRPAKEDFYGAMQFLDANADPYYVLLAKEGITDMTFAPEDCDLNGGHVTLDPISISKNNMLDSLELALITECYDNPSVDLRATGGIWHDRVVEAYDHNFAQMVNDLGGEDGVINTVLYGIPQLLGGYMTLGDDNSLALPLLAGFAGQALVGSDWPIVIHYIVPANYILLPEFFGPDGDADGDGWTNRQEYGYFASSGDYAADRAAYVAAALNPAVYPEGLECIECVSTGSGLYAVGSTACLAVPDPVGESSTFHWSKVGGDLSARVYNTECRWIKIQHLQLSDSGVYQCVYDDGSKAEATYQVTVKVSETVPVAGPFAMAFTALLLGGLGALRRRRK